MAPKARDDRFGLKVVYSPFVYQVRFHGEQAQRHAVAVLGSFPEHCAPAFWGLPMVIRVKISRRLLGLLCCSCALWTFSSVPPQSSSTYRPLATTPLLPLLLALLCLVGFWKLVF